MKKSDKKYTWIGLVLLVVSIIASFLLLRKKKTVAGLGELLSFCYTDGNGNRICTKYGVSPAEYKELEQKYGKSLDGLGDRLYLGNKSYTASQIYQSYRLFLNQISKKPKKEYLFYSGFADKDIVVYINKSEGNKQYYVCEYWCIDDDGKFEKYMSYGSPEISDVEYDFNYWYNQNKNNVSLGQGKVNDYTPIKSGGENQTEISARYWVNSLIKSVGRKETGRIIMYNLSGQNEYYRYSSVYDTYLASIYHHELNPS